MSPEALILSDFVCMISSEILTPIPANEYRYFLHDPPPPISACFIISLLFIVGKEYARSFAKEH